MKPDRNGIVKSWATVIPDALEHDDDLLDVINERIHDVEIPGSYCVCRKSPRHQRQNRTDTEYLLCEHDRFPDFQITIRVWATGSSLNASWYLKCKPGFLKGILGGYFKDDMYAYSFPRGVLDQQEFSSWSEITLNCVRLATKELADKLNVRVQYVQPHSNTRSS